MKARTHRESWIAWSGYSLGAITLFAAFWFYLVFHRLLGFPLARLIGPFVVLALLLLWSAVAAKSSREPFMKAAAKHVMGLIFSVALGICGGGICGATIVSFGDLIGRSCSTGDHLGNWSVGAPLVGAMFGAPLGAIVAHIAYPTLVRTIGIKRAILPATLGTLLGGFAGCLVYCTNLAVLTGVIGFFVALVWARIRIPRSDLSG